MRYKKEIEKIILQKLKSYFHEIPAMEHGYLADELAAHISNFIFRKSFDKYLREEFLRNTQNYPEQYHKMFSKKYARAVQKYNMENKDVDNELPEFDLANLENFVQTVIRATKKTRPEPEENKDVDNEPKKAN